MQPFTITHEDGKARTGQNTLRQTVYMLRLQALQQSIHQTPTTTRRRSRLPTSKLPQPLLPTTAHAKNTRSHHKQNIQAIPQKNKKRLPRTMKEYIFIGLQLP